MDTKIMLKVALESLRDAWQAKLDQANARLAAMDKESGEFGPLYAERVELEKTALSLRVQIADVQRMLEHPKRLERAAPYADGSKGGSVCVEA